jgi:hypothetical protein
MSPSEDKKMVIELMLSAIESALLNSLEKSTIPLSKNTRNWIKAASQDALVNLSEANIEFVYKGLEDS